MLLSKVTYNEAEFSSNQQLASCAEPNSSSLSMHGFELAAFWSASSLSCYTYWQPRVCTDLTTNSQIKRWFFTNTLGMPLMFNMYYSLAIGFSTPVTGTQRISTSSFNPWAADTFETNPKKKQTTNSCGITTSFQRQPNSLKAIFPIST